MTFKIDKQPAMMGYAPQFHWTLYKENKDPISPICQSTATCTTEEDCRKDIAAFKKAMASVRYAKVVGYYD